jgi:hypothetical protein
LPQPPQFSAFVVVSTQAPLEHSVSLPLQLDWQEPPLQTWPAAHLVPQPPQLFASAGMHAPPQASSPAVHAHCPAWQVCPLPQALPQAPQFC